MNIPGDPAPSHGGSRRRLAVVLAVATLVAPLGAGDFMIEGVVSDLETTDPATLDALAALGVTDGATATLTYTIDPGATALDGGPGAKLYFDALLDMVIQVGGWQVSQDLEAAFPTVTVGNNVSEGGVTGDIYSITTDGSDPSDLLAGGGGPGSVFMMLTCIDFNGNASSNAGPDQDASKYDLAFGTVDGPAGSFEIEFLGGGVGTGLCTKGQLLATAKYGRKVLVCKAKYTKKPPSADPEGAKEAACLAKALAKLEKQILKAIVKAFKKGGTCVNFAGDDGDVDETILLSVDTLVADVLVGVDLENKAERSLRAKLLRTAGVQWAMDAAAYARNAAKPNAEKLELKLGKALAKTTAKADKAIAAAEAQGIAYEGPDGTALAQAVRTAVQEIVVLIAGTL